MIVDTAVSELGRVDFLVNNAAAPKGDDRVPLVDLSEEQLRLVLEVKVLGSFFCAQAVSRVLVEQGEGGSIVNVSSIAGKRPRAASAAYAAGNAALDALTASLAYDLGNHGITVNSVCPGLVETSRWDSDIGTEGWEKRIRATVPLKRATDGDEVGQVHCVSLHERRLIHQRAVHQHGRRSGDRTLRTCFERLPSRVEP